MPSATIIPYKKRGCPARDNLCNSISLMNYFLNIMRLPQLLLQILVDGIQEFFRIQVVFAMFDLITMDTNGQILRHFTALYRLDTDGFQRVGEIDQVLVAIQLAADSQTPLPGTNRSDRVGRSRRSE